MQGGKPGFSEGDKCKPGLLRLSLGGNLEKPLMSVYGTEWKERGYGFHSCCTVLLRLWALKTEISYFHENGIFKMPPSQPPSFP